MLKSLLQQLPPPTALQPFPLPGQLFPLWQELLWVQDQHRAWSWCPREVPAQQKFPLPSLWVSS